ncbi:glycine cleavage system protein GcvH [candidate division WOR-3 bacterium]|nr:glycine cleavage system protein GcvH [candidate division WOR-3 bacterium]
MKILEDLKYAKTHEWVRIENNIATCGISDYAQSELSDVVFIELHPVGSLTEKGSPFGTIEAVKAVTDIYAPLTGKIIEVNAKLSTTPETVNNDPYGEGWMIKIEMSNPEELDSLLTPKEYEELVTQK